MARINISVSDDLKSRMDALSVNWSQVAQDAFETVVKIEELKGNNMQKEAGVARLRASKESNRDLVRAEGYGEGKEWALETAEYDQLERVAALAEALEGEWASPGAMHFLGEAIDDGQHPEEIAEFLFGTNRPSDHRVEGFIEGAAEVFHEV